MGKARPRNVKSPPRPVVLDSGALIAFERGDERMRALLVEARKAGARVVIPAGVLGQVWHEPIRQVAIVSLVKAAETSHHHDPTYEMRRTPLLAALRTRAGMMIKTRRQVHELL